MKSNSTSMNALTPDIATGVVGALTRDELEEELLALAACVPNIINNAASLSEAQLRAARVLGYSFSEMQASGPCGERTEIQIAEFNSFFEENGLPECSNCKNSAEVFNTVRWLMETVVSQKRRLRLIEHAATGCPHCNRSCKDEAEYRRHIELKHPDKEVKK